MHSQKGQSLVEMLVGLGIISILISASTYALVSVLRSSTVNEQTQTAGLISNSLQDQVLASAEANWNTFYNLQKGSANHYFLVTSPTTTPSAIKGDESVLSENIINGLVGQWKFDELGGSWAYDYSGQGNHGQLNGPTRTASTTCKIGSCLGFAAEFPFTLDDYVSVTDSSSFDLTNFTVYAWIKFNDFLADSNIVSQVQVSGGYWMMEVYGDQPNQSRLSAYSSLDGIINNTPKGPALNNDQWHQIAISRDTVNDVVTWWVDGVSVGSQTTASDATYSLSGNINIGAQASPSTGSLTRFFDGYIDDVRIYNRALSATEITQLYNSSVYNRYFYVDNVNRLACGTGDITANAVTSCVGSANDVGEDPATQKITFGVNWYLKGIQDSLENWAYVTRWVNNAASQKSWSGSTGVAGPITEFTANYFDKTNVSVTSDGKVKLLGF